MHLPGGRHLDEGRAWLRSMPVNTAPWRWHSRADGQPISPGCLPLPPSLPPPPRFHWCLKLSQPPALTWLQTAVPGQGFPESLTSWQERLVLPIWVLIRGQSWLLRVYCTPWAMEATLGLGQLCALNVSLHSHPPEPAWGMSPRIQVSSCPPPGDIPPTLSLWPEGRTCPVIHPPHPP